MAEALLTSGLPCTELGGLDPGDQKSPWLVTLLRAAQHNVYPCKRWQNVYKYIDIIAEVAPDG